MSIAVIKGFLATLLYSYVKDSNITWMLIVLIQFFIGLFIELPLLGFGTRKVDAECFNIKDATVIGHARNMAQGYFKFYIPRLKVPTYRYIVDGKLYISTPDLMSNLPGYNPVAGPCTIRVKKKQAVEDDFSFATLCCFHFICTGVGLADSAGHFVVDGR